MTKNNKILYLENITEVKDISLLEKAFIFKTIKGTLKLGLDYSLNNNDSFLEINANKFEKTGSTGAFIFKLENLNHYDYLFYSDNPLSMFKFYLKRKKYYGKSVIFFSCFNFTIKEFKKIKEISFRNVISVFDDKKIQHIQRLKLLGLVNNFQFKISFDNEKYIIEKPNGKFLKTNEIIFNDVRRSFGFERSIINKKNN